MAEITAAIYWPCQTKYCPFVFTDQQNKAPSTITVTLGEYKLHSSIEPLPQQTFHVVKAVVHPNFKFSPAADRFDVAVLKLDRPVQVTS